jgi:hypothetical protein
VTTPITTNSITGLTATVLSNNSVTLSWTSSATLTSAQVNIITTVGRQSFTPVTANGNVSSITINNLHSGWQFDFSITGTLADNSTVTSGTITTQMTGDPTAAVVGNPTAATTPATTTTTTTAPTTTTTPVAAGAATMSPVTATVLSNNSVRLNWTLIGATQSSLQVGITTTMGRTSYPSISYASNATSVTITGLHAGWQFDFTVTSIASDGTTLTSDPVTAMTTASTTNAIVPATIAKGSSLAA